MAFITTLEVIPYSIYEKISKGYEDATVVNSDDFEGYLDAILSEPYPPDLSSVLFCLKHYLTFHYVLRIPDIQFSFEEEFILRVGTFFSYIDAYSEGYTYSMSFLVDQIKEVVENLKNLKIDLRFLTQEEFDERLVTVSHKKYSAQRHENEGNLAEVVIPEYQLYSSIQKSTGIGLFEEEIVEIHNQKDKFLILYELGVIDYIAKEWGWIGKKDFKGNIETLDTNHTDFGKLL